jgi:hypothetical protein
VVVVEVEHAAVALDAAPGLVAEDGVRVDHRRSGRRIDLA